MATPTVLVRFTGTRPGTVFYQGPGTRRYKFGQNDQHFQAQVSANCWYYLKQKYGRELLEIPQSLHARKMDLGCLVSVTTLLTDGEKRALLAANFKTIGEIMADAGAATALLPYGNNVSDRLVDAVFYGKAPSFQYALPPSDDLRKIAHVGLVTAARLITAGFADYAAVAGMTQDQWNSIPGVAPANYEAVITSAQELLEA